MFPILQLGPLAIQVPGLVLLAGFWVLINVIEKEAPRHKISPDTMSNMILIGLIAGIIGARLWYVARFISVYIANPLSLFSLNPATLATTAGIFIGLLAAVIYAQRKDLPLWPTLDALAPGFAVFALALGLSHVASGDAFGAPSTVPWAIELWGAMRHPSQLYEIAGAIIVLLILWRVKKQKTFPGFTFLAWVALSATSQIFLEAFRGDSIIILNSLRRNQVVGLVIMLAALLGLHLLVREKTAKKT
ncbi:MAG: prolipoprotein diacylglyceryl transferase [Chloroflexi bacterium]|nr:prolipoprotein diacylglyceryl transferase [Chloroflexota bacterium]